MKPAKIPPKPGKETIYIDVDDEITSIIDKIDSAKQKVVALVLPKRATVMQSVVNMRLLKRSAEKAKKSVVLITGEEALLPLAGAVGLHVAKNLQTKPAIPTAPHGAATEKILEKELAGDLDNEPEVEPTTKLDYHRSVGELATAHAEDDSKAIDLEDEDAAEDKDKPTKPKKTKDKKLSIPNFDRFRLLLGGGILAFILLIVFIILAIFVLPKATITIVTGSIPVQTTLTLNAADSIKTLDEANNAIPATLKTTQETATAQVPATGQQNNGTNAKGRITVSTTCTKLPASVPAGTAAISGGLTFTTTDELSFHNTGSDSHGNFTCGGDADIRAGQAGSKYNLASGSAFTISGYSGSNSNALSGGTDNIITVVSQADLDTARNKITSADSDKFSKDFLAQLDKQGFYVLSSTLKPSDPASTANPALGQPATNTTVTTQITYTVLAVQKADLTKAITDALNKKIEKTKQKLSDADVLKNATVTVQSQGSPTTAVLSISDDTTAVPIIDAASIKKQATGKKSAAIKSAVSDLPGVKSVKVKLSPFWVSKAPKASKITVVQQQVKTSGG